VEYKNECPECENELFFEPSLRKMICRKCGLFASRDEVTNMRRTKREGGNENQSNRQNDDYLKWWHSKKK
jgi:hypothetical protein|tara:strand:- start:83 stop:292 length:210 start_codon:yes stop_codon:yes gene_type:complete